MRFGGATAAVAALAKRLNPNDSNIGSAIKALLLRRKPRRDGRMDLMSDALLGMETRERHVAGE
ncbi:hypothetical protein RBSWK_00313 [Rhodopirellula baltica SWK14]|uniref:Uncharacterized protein n=1 Tax=Rhodopirellula baltica SWK14 TaxID=993516 RepID=L7CPG5_RHOBT|nr:hypothetical protein RBSWK_00313 [Rhodopirellula baltica SWK14]